MKWTRVSIAFLCCLLLFSLLSCAQSGRKPLETPSFGQTLSGLPGERIVVRFEEFVPGKPLSQTVWDNISGPFWDPAESRQVGFTRSYKPQFFYIPPAMIPIYAKSGINLNDTQILMPFGQILTQMFESAARKNFPQAVLCDDESCVQGAGTATVLRIGVEKFFVWEAPRDHLNLYVRGKSSCLRNGTVKEHRFEKSMLYQKVGGLLSPYSREIDEKVGGLLTTPDRFMDEMIRMSQLFAESLTVEILQKGL